jgi:hypothetical protein
MRRILMLAIVVISLWCGGCKRDLTVSDFPLQAGITAEQVADKVGSPTREAAHWIAYKLKDKTELRLFFLAGPKGGTRTLTEAAVYDALGTKIKVVFEVPTARPTTKSTPMPATRVAP